VLREGQDDLVKLFLGVDGGQSGTEALISDEHGEVLGQGSAGPCNHVGNAEAEAKLVRVISECVGLAVSAGGLSQPQQFKSACFGMSGGAADKEATLHKVVAAEHWLVTDDAVIALAGALAGEPGVVTIAGTGSIALGRVEDGLLRRAGGWGYIFGDEGSAFDIVRQGLRACLRAEEGWGPHSQLAKKLLANTGCRDMNEVMHAFYKPEWPRSRVASLAREVDACAAEGDEIAGQVLSGAAQSLALLAQSVRRQLWGDAESVRCTYVGGVFRSALVRERYRALLELGGSHAVAPTLSPAAGALIEAYRISGVHPAPVKLLSSKFPA